MVDINQVREQVQAMAAEQSKVREIAKKFLIPAEDTKESKDPERMAMSIAAVEVVCSLVNIFGCLQSPTQNSAYALLTDLTTSLNTNPFWVRNQGSLATLLIASVNGANDARELSVGAEPRWDALREQSKNLWVEMLPQIVFMAAGYATMRLTSVEIKKTFLGLVNG